MWRKIKDYENYSISDGGEVRNDNTNAILKPWVATGGYLNIALCKDGKKRTKRVHRIVAEAYCTREDGYDEVNHIDGNKQNNNASNLEWTTKSKNMLHAYQNGLQKRTAKGIVHSVTCLTDGKSFRTVREASEYYGISRSRIHACCKRLSTRSDLIFRYVSDADWFQ